MVVTCDIEFDNNTHGTYFAGQEMSGRITLKSDKVKKVRGVALEIKGFAHTNWTESHTTSVSDGNGGSTSVTNTVDYSGHENYIASLTYVLGSENNGQTVNIEPGTHIYNFSCLLPVTCPTSYEGIHGHIRYTVKVELKRPWKFDQTFMKGFTVLRIMDLNYESPTLRMPSNTEIQKIFGWFAFKSEPLLLHLKLPQSGFVPGQDIPVSLLVTNDSHILVKEVKAKLVMLVCYSSQCGERENQRIVLSKVKGEEPVPRHCKKLLNFSLNVPATPPTSLNLCRFIQIAYQIELEAKVQGFHSNQVICTPVTIGNVPLQDISSLEPTTGMNKQLMGLTGDDATKTVEPAGAASLPKIGDCDSDERGAQKMTLANEDFCPSSSWAAGTNLPPPSYEEAVHMPKAKINKDEAHDYSQSDFTPRYPVFQITTPTAPTAEDIEWASAEMKK